LGNLQLGKGVGDKMGETYNRRKDKTFMTAFAQKYRSSKRVRKPGYHMHTHPNLIPIRPQYSNSASYLKRQTRRNIGRQKKNIRNL
jgi:hypothetical protein